MSDLDPELRQLLAPICEATRPEGPRRAPTHDGSLAREAAHLDGRARVASGELSAAARERIVGSMRQQVRAVPRARRRARIVRRVRLGALFSAGLLACGALLWPRLTPGVDALFGHGLANHGTTGVHIAAVGVRPLSWTGSQGVTQELRGELDLPGDGELQVPDRASALLTTSTGVRIDASERTRVRVRGAAGAHDQGLALERGTVRCRVPPLGRGQSFVVSTATTRVVVHGTDFSVALGGELGTEDAAPAARENTPGAGHAQKTSSVAAAPCVRVREGLVEVQQAGAPSAWLGPGSAWGCGDEVASALVPVVPSTSATVPALASERTSRGRHHGGHGRVAKAREVDRSLPLEPSDDRRARGDDADTNAPPASTLERENRLLADGLRAEQTGDQQGARRLFSALLAEFPQTPLAPEARAGLTRTRLVATQKHD
jgi:hypothetical protein